MNLPNGVTSPLPRLASENDGSNRPRTLVYRLQRASSLSDWFSPQFAGWHLIWCEPTYRLCSPKINCGAMAECSLGQSLLVSASKVQPQVDPSEPETPLGGKAADRRGSRVLFAHCHLGFLQVRCRSPSSPQATFRRHSVARIPSRSKLDALFNRLRSVTGRRKAGHQRALVNNPG